MIQWLVGSRSISSKFNGSSWNYQEPMRNLCRIEHAEPPFVSHQIQWSSIHIIWLVLEENPPWRIWKIWVRQLGWWFPIYGKIKNMFQSPPTSHFISSCSLQWTNTAMGYPHGLHPSPGLDWPSVQSAAVPVSIGLVVEEKTLWKRWVKWDY